MNSLLLTVTGKVHGRAFLLMSCMLAIVFSVFATDARAAITWDGEGGSHWWFDPQNWSEDESNGGAGFLPPTDEGIFEPLAQDAQINGGHSADFDNDGDIDGDDGMIW